MLDAFYKLSPSRTSSGFGVGAIPFEAVDAYAKRYSINHPDDFDEFYQLIRAADRAYLRVTNEKTQRKSGRDDD